MTIKFTYTDTPHDEYGAGVRLEVETNHEHLEGVIESFKRFLTHVGHHPDNVGRVVFEESEGRNGLPQQLELPLSRPEAL